MKVFVILACVTLLTLTGCGRPAPETPANAPTSPPSASRQVVEDVVGYTTIKEGRKARDRIKEAAAREEEALKEVMEQ